jgi:type III secretory pathway lipoprotein EscJ
VLQWTLLVLLACAQLATRSAHAELPPAEPVRAAPEPPLLVRLAPTAGQRHHERTRVLEQRLVRLVSALPDVERAEVVLDLPLDSEQPLDRPLPPPRVTAVITTRSPGQTRAAIERIVSAALPELGPHDLSVIETPSRRTPASDARVKGALSLVQIGPFRVHPASASALRCGLAVLLGTNALLAAILLWRTRLTRSRTDRRTES